MTAAYKTPYPIFLLAPPRSFTTLVTGMLGQHPQTFGLPELTVFFHETLRDIWVRGRAENAFDTRLKHGLLRAVAEVYFGEQTDEAIQGAEHWCARRQSWTTGQIFDELREKLAPFHIVEKSPDYTLSVDIMKRMFDACPDAKIVFMTRHPIKQCESALNINEGTFPRTSNSYTYVGKKAVLDPQIAWHDMNVNVLNFLETYVPKDQHIRIKGEDLLADPDEEFKKLCRWLGLRDDDEALAKMQTPERSPFASFGPISALFGNDPNFLRNPFFRRMKKLTLPPLDSDLSWRDDGGKLLPEVIDLAKEFGY